VSESILVINPNSSETVTRGIDAACEPLRNAGAAIECITLADGPPGIETQQDVESAVGPLIRTVRQREKDHDAFVVACYSDPGLQAVRELTKKPVFGIAECAILTALTLGYRFGVIAILQQSVIRHLRYAASLGLTSRLAAELPIGLGISDLANEEKTFKRMVGVAEKLRDDHGADVVVMGCAGMARYRKGLQDAIGLPVVEPTQAAVAMALGRVKLGWHTA
jgi:allantoin racemase